MHMYLVYVWDTKQVIFAILVSCFALLEKPTINRCLSCRCLPCLLLSFRLPAWLAAPPVLTNLPFLPALGRLGTSCTAGGLEGVCEAQCAGQGLVRAGHCTRGQSVCCAGGSFQPFLALIICYPQRCPPAPPPCSPPPPTSPAQPPLTQGEGVQQKYPFQALFAT